jgi:hypothetical protein
MAARPQWYFWSIGLTNSVQPYCKLAIITMQMMPKTSWLQRVAGDAIDPDGTVVDAVDMFPPPQMNSFLLLTEPRFCSESAILSLD